MEVKNNYEWESAKSNRSRCRRCNSKIGLYEKRLKVLVRFGNRDGYVFYCEPCANISYDLSYVRGLRESPESVKQIMEGGQGKFCKHFRKIVIVLGDTNG